MLKLRTNTEDWRELITGRLSVEDLDEVQIDDLADQLCQDVLDELGKRGIAWLPAHAQSVGAFAIVQGGTDAEQKAYNEIVAEQIEAARSRLANA